MNDKSYEPRLLVFLASPYRADDLEGYVRNLAYLHDCMQDSIKKHEAPFAPHAMYTKFLTESDKARAQGVGCGLNWVEAADVFVAYVDLGITEGMQLEIDEAFAHGLDVEQRRLGGKWKTK